MSKEVWCEAYERLAHHLKREPTEDEIRDYIAARHDELYEHVAEMRQGPVACGNPLNNNNLEVRFCKEGMTHEDVRGLFFYEGPLRAGDEGSDRRD